MSSKLLLVDDSQELLTTLANFLKRQGYIVSQASTRSDAVTRFGEDHPDLCIVDYELPDGTAFDVLSEVRKRDPKAALIVLTGFGTIELAVEAIKLGAEHFLTKPIDLHSLSVLIERVLRERSEQRRRSAEQRTEERLRVDPFAGSSTAIERVRELATAVVASEVPVLLTGETGTGKGVLARWLHDNGRRTDEAFVDLNCAGLSRELAESELFGHQRGSFTSANATKRGLLEIAHHGTLFLDEIGDLDVSVQPKLLKALEDKTYRRVGDVQTRSADVRLISATHRNLAEMARSSEFRNDLLFRINTVTIELPALRDRQDDLPLLSQLIIEHLCRQLGRPAVTLSSSALQVLRKHAWPGNLRELRNVLERALLFCRSDVVEPQMLAVSAPAAAPFANVGANADANVDNRLTLDDVERRHILMTLESVNGRVDEAAKLLDVPRSSLYAKLKRYGAPV